MRSLREAREASGSGKNLYPIQDRETQKAAVSSTHFQIRSEAHGAYMMLCVRALPRVKAQSYFVYYQVHLSIWLYAQNLD